VYVQVFERMRWRVRSVIKYRLQMLPKKMTSKRLKSAKRFTKLRVDKEPYEQELVIFLSVSGRLSFFKYAHTSENIDIIHKKILTPSYV
jgi:hypothetical protein